MAKQRLIGPGERLFIGKELRRQLLRIKVEIVFPDQLVWRFYSHVMCYCDVSDHEPALSVFEIDMIR